MTALAWPFVVLVLGLLALRILWELAISQRRPLRDVIASAAEERARLDIVAGIVDSGRDRDADLSARIEALEHWRTKLKNLGVVRD